MKRMHDWYSPTKNAASLKKLLQMIYNYFEFYNENITEKTYL